MVTRTNCEAELVVSRKDEGPFVVSVFETLHNHELIATNMSYMLRSNRNLNIGHQSVLHAMKEAGIGVSVACKFMEKESGGVPNVGFTRNDAYNHIDRVKRLSKLANEDASDVLKYFASKSNAESFFFWKHECDEDGRLMNFFFRDSRSALNYEAFGDVLSLDTTYRTNWYNMTCAPFVGLNHHSQNVMFGMVFLSDETTNTLNWLLETFLESMHGKELGLIYTDQALALMKAIDETFTSAKHRLCQWHISQNAPGHFGNLNGNKEFKALWYKCMDGVDTEIEWEETWRHMMETYTPMCTQDFVLISARPTLYDYCSITSSNPIHKFGGSKDADNFVYTKSSVQEGVPYLYGLG